MKEAVKKLQQGYVTHALRQQEEQQSEGRTLVTHTPPYERLVRLYFEAWNAHDLHRLGELVSTDVTYQDWERHYAGWSVLAASEAATFAAVPNIAIEVANIHVAGASSTAVAEFNVKLNDSAGGASRGVYVMQFDAANKIAAVRAYKG